MFKVDTKKISVFIAQLRKEKGMSQKDLAEQLRVSEKAVRKWERGLSLPDIVFLQPMADIFGVTVSELLGGERAAEKEPEAEQVEELVRGILDSLIEREDRITQEEGQR